MILLRPRRRLVKPCVYEIPAGGEIYWYGQAGDLPAEWSIDTDATDCMIMGADASDDTVTGSDTHAHTYSANTGSAGYHSHSASHNGTTGTSGSTAHYGTANVYAANAGHSHGSSSGGTSNAAAHAHGLSATGSRSSLPPYRKLYLIKAGAGAEVPLGGIVVWSGAKVNIPEGFAVCDGTGETQNLSDRFVKIAINDTDMGEAGGSATHTHTNSKTTAGGSHSHTFSIGTGSAATTREASDYSGGSVAAGHSHTVSGSTDSDPNHTHTIPDTGAASSLPSFVYIYYIQKVA